VLMVKNSISQTGQELDVMHSRLVPLALEVETSIHVYNVSQRRQVKPRLTAC